MTEPDGADVRTLARLWQLPIPEDELDAVAAQLRVLRDAMAVVDSWTER
jgi:hypothetical protein